jgi:hypothetical protein
MQILQASIRDPHVAVLNHLPLYSRVATKTICAVLTSKYDDRMGQRRVEIVRDGSARWPRAGFLTAETRGLSIMLHAPLA